MSRLGLGAVLVFLLLLWGCTSAPLMTPAPVAALGDSTQTRRAILLGMNRRGWTVENEEPGRVLARLELRRHVARTAIDYDDRQIRFSYAGSQNLGCKPAGDSCSSIHRNYNHWVRMLSVEIASAATELEIMARPTHPTEPTD